MNTPDLYDSWNAFQDTNRFRRAIRAFSSATLNRDDVLALLTEATLAPSSGNLQPYQVHWVQDPSMKMRIAQACNGQKAAGSAAELLVFVASPALGQRTALSQLNHIETSTALDTKSKAYHRKQTGKFQRLLGRGASALWSPLLVVASLIRPALSLLPVSHIGSRHWAARNTAYAAQTLMLAAAAKGIDSCPMEGFSAPDICKILGLPRGSVVPLIIALGYRAENARIEERWRLPLTDIVVEH